MQDLRTGRASRRRQAHVHRDVSAIERHVIDQSQVHDVEADLRILHSAKREANLVLGQLTAFDYEIIPSFRGCDVIRHAEI